MLISDLNILEVVEETANVQGGLIDDTFYSEFDNVFVNFSSFNAFQTIVIDPRTFNNSAAAGAKADAQNNRSFFGFTDPTYSFTKADTLAVTDYLGESRSASTSAAVINRAF